MLNFQLAQLIYEERLREAKKQHYWQSRAGIYEKRLREAKKQQYWRSRTGASSFGMRTLRSVGALLIALGKRLMAYPAVQSSTAVPGEPLSVERKPARWSDICRNCC
jgi:hypothetical protein